MTRQAEDASFEEKNKLILFMIVQKQITVFRWCYQKITVKAPLYKNLHELVCLESVRFV